MITEISAATDFGGSPTEETGLRSVQPGPSLGSANANGIRSGFVAEAQGELDEPSRSDDKRRFLMPIPMALRQKHWVLVSPGLLLQTSA